ncbi:repetitive organellar protein-like [Diabrotica virgifera virgifera]|uniref:Uncharacterized protein n=1 Tax=Diabrotica virgifera virgifera TaxID=50390 RepID=A0ABM5IB71_DIAVI|nr:repetitive organellar protein-like [Diabrotica virgifera virgifera]
MNNIINKTLLMSLKQDVQSINQSLKNISIEENDIKSWLFPTKHYTFVDDFIKGNNILELNDVKLVLELVIDRLYIGLRLLSCTIGKTIQDKNLEISEFLLTQSRPMTVGYCFENFRKVITTLLDQMNTNLNAQGDQLRGQNGKDTAITNCKTQTDIISKATCDSCSSAIMSMKFLLDMFNITKGDIYQIRQAESNIHDITQFGCMLRATASIETQLKELIEKLIAADDENKNLVTKIKELTVQLKNKTGSITLLQLENNTLSDSLKKVRVKVITLENKISDFEKEKHKDEEKITNLNNINKELNSNVLIFKENNDRLKCDKKALRENVEKIRILLKDLQEISKLKEKLLTIESELHSFQDMFKDLNNAVEALNTRLKKISKNHIGMESSLKMLSCQIGKDTDNITKNFQHFQEKLRAKWAEFDVKLANQSNPTPKVQIKGNPIEDFTKQIEENNEKIKMLQNENTKLETIVNKYKTLRK